jgi:hypothetical protein
MITFPTFDEWHSVVGFVTAAFYFFIHPSGKSNSTAYKVFFFLIVLLGVISPLLVEIQPNEEQKLLGRSAKIAHTITFILLYYCYLHRETLQKSIPNFFRFTYFLGLYSLLELFLYEVLLSAKYQFVTIAGPYLQNNFGIVGFEFTSPISYLIKFIFIGLFLKDALQSEKWKVFFKYLIWALVIFELVQVFIFKSYQGYNSLSSTVKNFYILFGTSLLLYKIYSYPNVSLPLNKNPYFWICLGLILPALAELFLEFVFSKLYRTDLSHFFRLYLVRNASQIIGFTLLIIGVWQAKYLRFLPKEY